MDWGLLAGLLAIAVAIFWGLWGFRKDVSDKLSDIRDKVIAMGTTLEKAWDLISVHFAGSTGTIERNLKNLGKTSITARPGVNVTSYFIQVEKSVLQDGLIAKLSKETELEKKEKELFSGRIPMIYVALANHLRVEVPSVDPRICTEYISLLLRWLDSTYFEALQNIKDYEEPIQV